MSKEYRHIVRVTGTDVDGALKVPYALAKISGIGLNLANAILKKTGINPQTRVGFLSEAEIERIEEVIRDPLKYGIPKWMLDRQKDFDSGKDTHLIGSELDLQTKTDIERMKQLKSWKGYRHSYGLTVRGQRTRTTGRRGKALGVSKKEIREAKTSGES